MEIWKKITVGTVVGGALIGGTIYVLRLNKMNAELETIPMVKIHKLDFSGLTLRVDVQLKNPVNAYDAWAKRLKAAFDKVYGFLPGTDADAIVAVFNEIPTQTAFIQTAVSYKKLYGTNMLEDMQSEAEFGQYADWMKIITQKKKK